MNPHLRAKDRSDRTARAARRGRVPRGLRWLAALMVAGAALPTPALADKPRSVNDNLGGAPLQMAMSGRREAVQPANNTVGVAPPAQPSAGIARADAQLRQPNAQAGAEPRPLLHPRADELSHTRAHELAPPRTAN